MTIKEIAKLANVSLGTVDRVIHNRGKVSKKTEEKILKILKETNYKPNVYARGLVLNKNFTIGVLIPDYLSGEYWEVPNIGIQNAADDFSQFGIHVKHYYFNQNNIESFIKAANEILKDEPDGVILAPVINFEAVKLCTKLKKKAIPFILIDSNISGSGAISFIGQDAFQSGRLAAKLLKSCIRDGKILIVSIKNNENHNKTLQKRIEGFKDYLLQQDNIDEIQLEEVIIDQREKNWKRSLRNVLFEKHPEGIYVPSSKVHYVAEILNSSNEFSCSLVGNDLIANNSFFVESGDIDYVIGQRPETQGYQAVENLYKFLFTRQVVESSVYLPLDIITKENLMYYRTNF